MSQLADTRCPHCEARQRYHSIVTGGGPPEPGDVSVCANCRRVSVFHRDLFGALVRRRPTSEEREALRADIPPELVGRVIL